MAGNIWERPFGQQGASREGVQPTYKPLNQYYTPGTNYGADQNYNSSPISGNIREDNPQIAYSQYGQNVGVGNQTQQVQDWFYQKYPDFQRGYGMATLDNPYLDIDQYMQTLPGIDQLLQLFKNQSPYERGERDSTFAPRSRWITR